MIDNPVDIPIVATDNKIIGQLSMNVVPCEEDGNEELNEDMLSDDPFDLIGQSLDFKVKIDKVSGLPYDQFQNIFCEYEFYIDQKKYKTTVFQGKN